jgi:hypothetical protein
MIIRIAVRTTAVNLIFQSLESGLHDLRQLIKPMIRGINPGIRRIKPGIRRINASLYFTYKLDHCRYRRLRRPFALV